VHYYYPVLISGFWEQLGRNRIVKNSRISGHPELEPDIWYIPRNWTDLAEGCGIGKEWPYEIFDEIAPGAVERDHKTNLFRDCTTYRFAYLHFRPTDFHETWQEYVRMNCFIAKFWNFTTSPKYGFLGPHFGSFGEILGSIIRKWCYTEKRLTR